MDSTQMDSAQIEEFLSTICRFTLMILAFGNIPNFHEEFLAFCVTTLGDSADIMALQERLQEKFILNLRYKLSRFIHSGPFEFLDHDVKLDKEKAISISREYSLWNSAFEDLKDEIIMKINKQYFDFTWAICNFTDFTQKLKKYMGNFAKTRKIDITSHLCMEHFKKIKNNLQIMMNEYIEHLKDEHNCMCCDDGYAFDSKPYFICNCMPKQSEIEKELINNLDSFIDMYNTHNAFYADRSHDFDEEEISFKEILQRDFFKKLKKKKNHRKNKV